MPSDKSQVLFSAGTAAGYAALSPKNENTIYFLTDTNQIFVGSSEYTKGGEILSEAPTNATVGYAGKLYAYNGNLYLCGGKDAQNNYVYTRVANVNDVVGSITEITAGEGLNGGTITSTGTISHAVPAGAAETAVAGQTLTPDFGDTVTLTLVSGTDKYGHVTGTANTTIQLPSETAVTVETATGSAQSLSYGDSFTVVTGVELGTADQSIKRTVTEFTLPASDDTTYTFATGTEEGKILVTPSTGSAYEVLVKGWENLAKKSELASVFTFKGTVAKVSDLPKTGVVGDVYHVTAKNAEYVCITASASSADAVWEELGSSIDLSAYALSADVIQRVPGVTGQVAKFNEDGTLSSTGFTLGVSVPADAKFTDTTYGEASSTEAGLMSAADKAKLDTIDENADVNVLEGVQVNGTDLTIDGTKKVNVTLGSFGVTATADQLNDVGNKVSKNGDTITGDLTVTGTITGDVTGNVTGDVTGNVTGNLTGNADTATKATQDSDGNNIIATYATKDEVAAAIAWSVF